MHVLLTSDDFDVEPEKFFPRTAVPESKERFSHGGVIRHRCEHIERKRSQLACLLDSVEINGQVRIQSEKAFPGVRQISHLALFELAAALRKDRADAKEWQCEEYATLADVLRCDFVLAHEPRSDVPVLPGAGRRVESSHP